MHDQRIGIGIPINYSQRIVKVETEGIENDVFNRDTQSLRTKKFLFQCKRRIKREIFNGPNFNII